MLLWKRRRTFLNVTLIRFRIIYNDNNNNKEFEKNSSLRTSKCRKFRSPRNWSDFAFKVSIERLGRRLKNIVVGWRKNEWPRNLKESFCQRLFSRYRSCGSARGICRREPGAPSLFALKLQKDRKLKARARACILTSSSVHGLVSSQKFELSAHSRHRRGTAESDSRSFLCNISRFISSLG